MYRRVLSRCPRKKNERNPRPSSEKSTRALKKSKWYIDIFRLVLIHSERRSYLSHLLEFDSMFDVWTHAAAMAQACSRQPATAAAASTGVGAMGQHTSQWKLQAGRGSSSSNSSNRLKAAATTSMSADVAEGDVVVVVGASGGIGRLVTQRCVCIAALPIAPSISAVLKPLVFACEKHGSGLGDSALWITKRGAHLTGGNMKQAQVQHQSILR